MTRETTIRFPKKILGTAGKIARFAYQGPIDADSMWSRVAICAIPDSPVAVSFFASAFNGRVLRSPTLPSSVSRLQAEVLASAETVTDEIPELAKDLPVYFATDASLRLTEFSVGSLTACDPNAIIPEPDRIPAGGGGSGGGGNTQGPEYCDPNAVQIPPDCIIENEYIPDPDPASPQVFLTTGSSVAGCFDFSRRDLYINGSFFGVVLTSGFSCTTPMLFVGMTTALERESCFIWGFFCKWQRYGPPFLQNFPYLTVGQAVHQTTPYRKGYYRNGTSFDYSFASGYRKVSFTASPKVFVAR